MKSSLGPLALAFALMATPSAGLTATLDARVDVGGVPLIAFFSTALDKQAQLLEVGASLEAAVELALAWNEDPYLAFRIELTNLSEDAIPISFLLLTSATPFTGHQISATLETTLIDANGDDEAEWSLPGAGFGVVVSSLDGAFLLPPIQHALGAAGSLSTTTALLPIPPLFGTTPWDQLHANAFGNLSAGDTLILEGFLCVTPIGAACPARPVLTAEPAAGALALLALAALAARRYSGSPITHGSRRAQR